MSEYPQPLRNQQTYTAGLPYFKRNIPRCVTCGVALNSRNMDVQCWQCFSNHPLSELDKLKMSDKVAQCQRAIDERAGRIKAETEVPGRSENTDGVGSEVDE